jgi:hypothetical protein
MHEHAKTKGGKCLSRKYLGANIKLKWKCENGHIFNNSPSKVLGGQWCKKCSMKKYSKRKSSGIDFMIDWAKKHNGKCLSADQHAKSQTMLEWKCDKGHMWNEKYAIQQQRIKKGGKWCIACSKEFKKKTWEKEKLKELKQIALEKKGLLLSESYKNSDEKLRWKCSGGHIWEARATSIKHQGSWCSVCAGMVIDRDRRLEELKNIAVSMGGNCLASHIGKSNEKIPFECECGHNWETYYSTIKKGSWCPKCAAGKAWKTRKSKM